MNTKKLSEFTNEEQNTFMDFLCSVENAIVEKSKTSKAHQCNKPENEVLQRADQASLAIPILMLESVQMGNSLLLGSVVNTLVLIDEQEIADGLVKYAIRSDGAAKEK